MINYSAIPSESPRVSPPIGSLKLAVGLTFGILALVTVTALVAGENRGTALPVVSGLMFLVFITVVVIVFLKLFSKLGKQKAYMRKFALDNGWQFESKRTKLEPEALPEDKLMKNYNSISRFAIFGSGPKGDFEFHLLIGSLPTPIWTHWWAKNIAYFAVLRQKSSRISGNEQIGSNLFKSATSSYEYYLFNANPLSRDEVKSIFTAAGF